MPVPGSTPSQRQRSARGAWLAGSNPRAKLPCYIRQYERRLNDSLSLEHPRHRRIVSLSVNSSPPRLLDGRQRAVWSTGYGGSRYVNSVSCRDFGHSARRCDNPIEPHPRLGSSPVDEWGWSRVGVQPARLPFSTYKPDTPNWGLVNLGEWRTIVHRPGAHIGTLPRQRAAPTHTPPRLLGRLSSRWPPLKSDDAP